MISRRTNIRVASALGVLVACMIGLAYASAPLYKLFCQVTGFGGTPARAATPPASSAFAPGAPAVTVRFDANVNSALPWRFEPVEHQVTARLGEPMLISYRARNLSDEPVTGAATFNVQPSTVGAYFVKVACFCFDQQTIGPGETVEFPVSFYIDPEIAKDRETADVTTITLSYTFFRSDPPANAPTRVSRAPGATVN
jgi:cytochrome c oxidase assembly protein subunit 11